MKHGNAIFFEYGTCGHKREWRDDPALFQRWKEGRTGMPLVDANMRELAATGARPLPAAAGRRAPVVHVERVCCALLCGMLVSGTQYMFR
jgi:hypothetical protein